MWRWKKAYRWGIWAGFAGVYFGNKGATDTDPYWSNPAVWETHFWYKLTAYPMMFVFGFLPIAALVFVFQRKPKPVISPAASAADTSPPPHASA